MSKQKPILTDKIMSKILKNTKNKTHLSSTRAFFKNNHEQLLKATSQLDILKIIKNYKRSDSTKTNIVSVLGKHFKNDKFKLEYIEIKKRMKDRNTKNKPITEKENKALKITWKKLKAKRQSEYNNIALLYNLLVLIPETPRLDYSSLVFKPEKNVCNLIDYDDKEKKWYITLNHYKTIGRYGPWTFYITDDWFNKWLIEWFDNNNVAKGSYIFTKRTNSKRYESLSKPSFSRFIENVFKAVIGVKITINALRKIKERSLVHNNPKILKMSLQERNDLASNLFKHTYDSSLNHYLRV